MHMSLIQYLDEYSIFVRFKQNIFFFAISRRSLQNERNVSSFGLIQQRIATNNSIFIEFHHFDSEQFLPVCLPIFVCVSGQNRELDKYKQCQATTTTMNGKTATENQNKNSKKNTPYYGITSAFSSNNYSETVVQNK